MSLLNAGLVNHTRIDAFGLFTGQVGYAANNVLFYVKGGAAVTRQPLSTGAFAGTALDRAERDPLGWHDWRRRGIRLRSELVVRRRV